MFEKRLKRARLVVAVTVATALLFMVTGTANSADEIEARKAEVIRESLRKLGRPTETSPLYEAAAEAEALLEIQTERKGTESVITILTTNNPVYECFLDRSANRFIVDIYNTINFHSGEDYQVEQSPVLEHVRTSLYQLDPQFVSRVVFDLSEIVKMRVTQDDGRIIVRVPDDGAERPETVPPSPSVAELTEKLKFRERELAAAEEKLKAEVAAREAAEKQRAEALARAQQEADGALSEQRVLLTKAQDELRAQIQRRETAEVDLKAKLDALTTEYNQAIAKQQQSLDEAQTNFEQEAEKRAEAETKAGDIEEKFKQQQGALAGLKEELSAKLDEETARASALQAGMMAKEEEAQRTIDDREQALKEMEANVEAARAEKERMRASLAKQIEGREAEVRAELDRQKQALAGAQNELAALSGELETQRVARKDVEAKLAQELASREKESAQTISDQMASLQEAQDKAKEEAEARAVAEAAFKKELTQLAADADADAQEKKLLIANLEEQLASERAARETAEQKAREAVASMEEQTKAATAEAEKAIAEAELQLARKRKEEEDLAKKAQDELRMTALKEAEARAIVEAELEAKTEQLATKAEVDDQEKKLQIAKLEEQLAAEQAARETAEQKAKEAATAEAEKAIAEAEAKLAAEQAAREVAELAASEAAAEIEDLTKVAVAPTEVEKLPAAPGEERPSFIEVLKASLTAATEAVRDQVVLQPVVVAEAPIEEEEAEPVEEEPEEAEPEAEQPETIEVEVAKAAEAVAPPAIAPAPAPPVPPEEQTVTVTFRDAEINAVIDVWSRMAGINVLAGKDVRGTVTCRLRDVPVLDAMRLVLKDNGYALVRDGNIYRVIPEAMAAVEILAEMETRTFKLEYQTADSMELTLKSLTTPHGKVISNKDANVVIVTDEPENMDRIEDIVKELDVSAPVVLVVTGIYPLSYAKANEVAKIIEGVLTENGSVVADARSNQVLVTDVPENLQTIDELIPTLDQREPQAFLEVMMVDHVLQDDSAYGINWLSNARDMTNDLQSFTWNSTGLGDSVGSESLDAGVLTFGVLTDDLDLTAAIAGELQNRDAKLVANPSTLVLNNQKASIEIVSEYPFQQLTQTTQGPPVSNIEFKNIGVTLDVTPQITSDQSIIVELDARESSISGFSEGVPIEDSRTARTTLLINNGQTIYLAGLRSISVTSDSSRFPMLGSIPLVGFFFREATLKDSRTELLVFLTVHVVPGDAPDLTPYQRDRFEELPSMSPVPDGLRNMWKDISNPIDGRKPPWQWKVKKTKIGEQLN